MGGVGSIELLLLMLFALIFFGAKKLPEIARGLGKGMTEFKKAARDIQNEINREINQATDFTSSIESLPSTPPPPAPEEFAGEDPQDPYTENESDQSEEPGIERDSGAG